MTYIYDQEDITKAQKLVLEGKAYIVHKKTSASGMTRKIRVYAMDDNKMRNITALIAQENKRRLDKDWNLIVR
jgi:hypothetical protein